MVLKVFFDYSTLTRSITGASGVGARSTTRLIIGGGVGARTTSRGRRVSRVIIRPRYS